MFLRLDSRGTQGLSLIHISATLHIVYTGILNSEMRGFYLGTDDQGRKYAATQFESTDARRAYPSFDEPVYKACLLYTSRCV